MSNLDPKILMHMTNEFMYDNYAVCNPAFVANALTSRGRYKYLRNKPIEVLLGLLPHVSIYDNYCRLLRYIWNIDVVRCMIYGLTFNRSWTMGYIETYDLDAVNSAKDDINHVLHMIRCNETDIHRSHDEERYFRAILK